MHSSSESVVDTLGMPCKSPSAILVVSVMELECDNDDVGTCYPASDSTFFCYNSKFTYMYLGLESTILFRVVMHNGTRCYPRVRMLQITPVDVTARRALHNSLHAQQSRQLYMTARSYAGGRAHAPGNMPTSPLTFFPCHHPSPTSSISVIRSPSRNVTSLSSAAS